MLPRTRTIIRSCVHNTIDLQKMSNYSNDQVGIVTIVPVYGSFILGLMGLRIIGFIKKMARIDIQ